MPHEYGPETWVQIHVEHAHILGLLADDLTEVEVATALSKSESALKSAVERLKVVFGVKTVRELRRTWRAVRSEYVAYVAQVSGV